MSEGFSNPIVAAGGSLVYPSIHSPNYLAGLLGWTINKDGSAEFNNLTIRGTFFGTDFIINNSGIFFYQGTPALGNLSQSIVPGTVQIADPEGNTALPGVTTYSNSGGTFYANNLLVSQLVVWTAPSANGTYTQSAAGLFFLTGANTFINALVGQKIELSAPTVLDFAVDVLGILTAHTSLFGVDIHASSFMVTPALTVTSQGQFNAQSSAPGNSSGNAVVYANSVGMLSALLSTDGNHYSLLEATKTYDGPGQLINSVAFTQVGSLSIAVLSGVKYTYKAMAFYTSTFAAGNPVFSFGHPGVTMTNVWAHEEWSLSGGAVSQTNSDLSFLDVNGPTLNTGRTCYVSEGEFQPSANGNFILSAACTVAADTWTVLRAMLIVRPTEG